MDDDHPDQPPQAVPGAAGEAEIELAVVLGVFEAKAEATGDLAAVLARYVVLTRHARHCRNVDLLSGASDPARFVVVEKWDTPDAARAHLDATETVEMARAAVPLLARRPAIELLDTVSAHDLG